MEQDGAIFRKDDNGKLYRVGQKFSDDFENARTIRDLIGVERGWTAFTLQSPKSPTVEDYVRLRKRILTGQGDFLDNRIEPSGEVVHSGQTALKAYSVPRSGDAVTNKASLETELIHFVRGDDVWFAGWYYVPAEGGMPFTLMDLETTWFKEHPGIRIMVFGEKYLGVELKWGAKPTYRQVRGKEIVFPRAKWVHVKFHITLSEQHDGVVELWQDGTKIVDRSRPNLAAIPHASTIAWKSASAPTASDRSRRRCTWTTYRFLANRWIDRTLAAHWIPRWHWQDKVRRRIFFRLVWLLS